MLTEKQEAFCRDWITALRSGKYKQTIQFLRRRVDDDVAVPSKFCCLGVACDMLYPEGWESPPGIWTVAYTFRVEQGCEISLPEFLWFFIQTGLTRDYVECLSEMNDSGSTFAEIAAYIEQRIIPELKEIPFSVYPRSSLDAGQPGEHQ